ncbi:MAG: IS66 family transposase [Emcibacter sp.]|nr:IS66 family transposase [Emcibacter sp.]
MINVADLPEDVDVLKAIIIAQQDKNTRLELLVRAFKQAMFGRKSEKINLDQFELALEDIETAMACIKAEDSPLDDVAAPVTPKTRAANRGALPRHLPRIEEIITPESKQCSCGNDLHVIGEDVSERLDIIPAQFRVIVTHRPKYACRSCEAGIIQAPAPARLIHAGLPTEALVAHVLVSKYADHLPLYRQAQIYSRQGIDLDRSTLANWVGKAAFELKPVFDCLLDDLKTSHKLFMDETRAPVLDPGRCKTKTGYFWTLARDDRPWYDPGHDPGSGDAPPEEVPPPGVAYTYAPGRSGVFAENILDGFSGILQVDGYAGYNRLTKADRVGGPIELAYCWAHARRKLYDVAKNSTAPIAEEGLKHIAGLYRIEADIKGQAAETRLAQRQARSVPLMDAFESWLRKNRARVSRKSPLGEALSYIDKFWKGLTLYLRDGRVEMDNNAVERTIRPIALNRKNALFAGHDKGAENWGIIASLIETAKLNKIEPHAYITATLQAIIAGHKQSQIKQLLPWNYPTSLNPV